MSQTLEYMLDGFTAEVEYDAGGMETLVQNYMNELFRHVQRLNGVVPLESFDFKVESGSQYLYRWKTQDGRTWKQYLYFEADSDPGQTFTVNDQFRLSEFQNHRALRDHIVKLHGDLELQTVKIEFS